LGLWGFNCTCTEGFAGPLCAVPAGAVASGGVENSLSGWELVKTDVNVGCSNKQCIDLERGYECDCEKDNTCITSSPTANPTKVTIGAGGGTSPPTTSPSAQLSKNSIQITQQITLTGVDEQTFIANKQKLESATEDAVFDTLKYVKNLKRTQVRAKATYFKTGIAGGTRMLQSNTPVVVLDVAVTVPASEKAMITSATASLEAISDDSGRSNSNSERLLFQKTLAQELSKQGADATLQKAAQTASVAAPARESGDGSIADGDSSSLSSGQMIGLAVGCVIGVLLIAGTVWFFCLKNSEDQSDNDSTMCGTKNVIAVDEDGVVKYGDTDAHLAVDKKRSSMDYSIDKSRKEYEV